MASPTRRPIALSLQGFSFSHRNSYFDWRLLHGIDVDTVARTTDVKSIEECLDTLQHGSTQVDRGLSRSNCIQVYRLLQLAVEYLNHLRSAHAALLEAYNYAIECAEGWNSCAQVYLESGSSFIHISRSQAALSCSHLDAVDSCKAALEGQDRLYNAALDQLEAEDTRARNFRFRSKQNDLNWASLYTVDLDQLIQSMDVAQLENVLPQIMHCRLSGDDAESLTPHHFNQLLPLTQAVLDYMLFQASATAVLLEEAMSKLQSVCADIPILTSATQDMHAQITHLLLEAQGHMAAQTAPNSALAAAAAHGNVGPMTSIATGSMMGGRLGSAGGYGLAPMPQRSASPSFGGTGIGRSGSATVHSNAAGTVQVMRLGSPTGTLQQQLQQQQLSPLPRSPTRFGSYAGAQPHMLHSAGAVSPTYPAGLPTGVDLPRQGGLQGWQQPGTAAAQQPLLGSGLIGMYEDVLAMSKSGVPLPVIELQTRAYELGYKVESIENDLRQERSKTEEMRRILADIHDRLNRPPIVTSQQPRMQPSVLMSPFQASQPPVSESTQVLPHPFASYQQVHASTSISVPPRSPPAHMQPPQQPMHVQAGAGSSGGGGAAAGTHMGFTPTKVTVVVDEDGIRQQQAATMLGFMHQQMEQMKANALRDHHERRTSATGTGTGSAYTGPSPRQDSHQRQHQQQQAQQRQPRSGGQPGSPGRSRPSKQVSRRPTATDNLSTSDTEAAASSGGAVMVRPRAPAQQPPLSHRPSAEKQSLARVSNCDQMSQEPSGQLAAAAARPMGQQHQQGQHSGQASVQSSEGGGGGSAGGGGASASGPWASAAVSEAGAAIDVGWQVQAPPPPAYSRQGSQLSQQGMPRRSPSTQPSASGTTYGAAMPQQAQRVQVQQVQPRSSPPMQSPSAQSLNGSEPGGAAASSLLVQLPGPAFGEWGGGGGGAQRRGAVHRYDSSAASDDGGPVTLSKGMGVAGTHAGMSNAR